MLPLLLIVAAAGLLLEGCASQPSPARETFPDNPPPEDVLAKDPCSVQREPEISFKTQDTWSPEEQAAWVQRIRGDLKTVQKINPLFTCGLSRIQVMDGASFAKEKDNPDTVAFYRGESREIHIQEYSPEVLFHEIGHHIHNLGILAPVVNDFRNTGWFLNDKGEWSKKSSDLFLSAYAQKNFYEDWADHFSMMAAYPLEIGLSVYYPNPIHSTNQGFFLPSNDPSLVRKRLDILGSSIHFPKIPLQRVKFNLQGSMSLPPSDIALMEGNEILLFNEESRQWSSFDIEAYIRTQNKVIKGVPEMPWMDVNQGDIYFKKSLGNLEVFAGRMNYFSPNHGGAGIGFTVWDRKNKTTQHYFPKGINTILGDFQTVGGKLGFFTRENEGIRFHKFNPSNGATEPVFTTKLPEGFTAVHVIPISGTEEFLVMGEEGRGELKMLRVRKDDHARGGFLVSTKDTINLPVWREEDLETPVLQGNSLIIPLKTFQFLHYDLITDKFSLIDPEFQEPPEQFASLQKMVSRNGRLFLLGKDSQGATRLSQVEFQKI